MNPCGGLINNEVFPRVAERERDLELKTKANVQKECEIWQHPWTSRVWRRNTGLIRNQELFRSHSTRTWIKPLDPWYVAHLSTCDIKVMCWLHTSPVYRVGIYSSILFCLIFLWTFYIHSVKLCIRFCDLLSFYVEVLSKLKEFSLKQDSKLDLDHKCKGIFFLNRVFPFLKKSHLHKHC